MLAEAAHDGDVEAMEHYARHNLIAHFKDPARYWLEKAIDSGNASQWAIKTIRHMKWHLNTKAVYLTETDKVER